MSVAKYGLAPLDRLLCIKSLIFRSMQSLLPTRKFALLILSYAKIIEHSFNFLSYNHCCEWIERVICRSIQSGPNWGDQILQGGDWCHKVECPPRKCSTGHYSQVNNVPPEINVPPFKFYNHAAPMKYNISKSLE